MYLYKAVICSLACHKDNVNDIAFLELIERAGIAFIKSLFYIIEVNRLNLNWSSAVLCSSENDNILALCLKPV